MPKVTVGVLRNNLWSLRLDTQTNLLFANIYKINICQLKQHVKANTYSESSTIQLGELLLKKEQDVWIASFPGIALTFQNWLVSENSEQQNTLRLLSYDRDIHELLEFVIHMFECGQLQD